MFGQASYRLNDHLRAHVGIRYSDEEKEIDFESYSFVPISPALTGPEYVANRLTPSGPPTVTYQGETDSDSVTPRFGIDFILNENVMFYFGATRGFKSGGYNTVLFGPVPEAVKPETIWSFEGGFKSTLADGKLRLNASAFYYDYKDIHQNVDLADNAQGYANVRNAGDAEVFGIEADMVFAVTDRFVVDGMFSYLDGKLYADDLLAVISHYQKQALILVGWSSGALVIGDYLRRHGQTNISGIVMVSGLHGLGIAELTDMLGTGPGEYMPDTMADDLETQHQAMQRCIQDMVVDITPAQLQLITAQAMMTTPAVRAAMMNRVIDNTDVLTSFSKPALIIHGRHDPFILVDAAEHLHKLCSRSTLSIYEKSAHMPFREESEKFNRELARFTHELSENNL